MESRLITGASDSFSTRRANRQSKSSPLGFRSCSHVEESHGSPLRSVGLLRMSVQFAFASSAFSLNNSYDGPNDQGTWRQNLTCAWMR